MPKCPRRCNGTPWNVLLWCWRSITEKDIEARITKDFDKNYNPTWHCTVEGTLVVR